MIPNHVAIILDGNGRWAKEKGMPRNYGHTMGAKNVEVISKAAYDLGIRYLTLYAFSYKIKMVYLFDYRKRRKLFFNGEGVRYDAGTGIGYIDVEADSYSYG